MPVERNFSIMGTSAHLLLVEPSSSRLEQQWAEGVLDRVRAMLEEMERRWTRFDKRSELSHLNRSPGVPVMVHDDTFDLISRAVEGWAVTGGGFDPTVLAALESAGYDRSLSSAFVGDVVAGPFEARAGWCHRFEDDQATSIHDVEVPGPCGVVLDAGLRTVTLPHGVRMDLGGIAKGYAAEVVAREIMTSGAAGACVDLGGDVRVVGEGPGAQPWGVTVEHPLRIDDVVDTLWLTDGAVVTSSSSRRRWSVEGRQMHHIIDPGTGAPAQTGLASVTVVAAEATWAEVIAKAAFVSGPVEGARLISDMGVAGILVECDGTVTRTAGIEEFEG